MKTKILTSCLVLMVVIAGGAYGQTGSEDTRFFINAGIGLGPTGGYSMGIPPISASADFVLPIGLPITAGAFFGFSTWTHSVSAWDITWTNIGFGARGMWHFISTEDWNVYAGLTLGYVIQNASVDGPGGGQTWEGTPFFLWGFNVGARWFFTDNIGAFAELGWSGLQFASIGITLRF